MHLLQVTFISLQGTLPEELLLPTDPCSMTATTATVGMESAASVPAGPLMSEKGEGVTLAGPGDK